MADIRIKDLATTATTTASDDFMAVDGATNGTRKLSAAAPAFLTSVTTPSLTSPASTNLTLGLGTGGTALTLASSTLAATFAGAVTTGGVTKVQQGAAANYAANTGALIVSTTTNLTGLSIEAIGDFTPSIKLFAGGTAASNRNWGFVPNYDASGGFSIRQSTAQYGDPIAAGATKFQFAANGDATFAGAVTVTGALKLGNAYVAGAVVGTGSITIQDSTGTTYRIPVLV